MVKSIPKEIFLMLGSTHCFPMATFWVPLAGPCGIPSKFFAIKLNSKLKYPEKNGQPAMHVSKCTT